LAYYDDLLNSADKLLGNSRGRPQFSNCNRAVSTAYYAIFDLICRSCADRVCGPIVAGQRPSAHWVQVYRCLDHSSIKKKLLDIPSDNPTFAHVSLPFKKLQEARHSADYDPSRQFSKAEAEALISEARVAIQFFKNLPRENITDLIIAFLGIKQKS
jgi:uncharacterized protein (UPF0332 family)